MCIQYVKLRQRNASGLKYSYVPCGKCADCRKKMAAAWSFRMNSEFHYLKSQGWNIAFCTLTYSEDNLPYIPEKCFKSGYKPIPCFSRSQVRSWIDNIRHYCKRHYRLVNGDNIRYFIASEYGSESHRPHYHAILAFPNRVSYQEMHEICSRYWTHGLLFPRDYRGDAANDCMSFEVVGDASKVLNYCSKYVCKDLAFMQEISDSTFYNYKEYSSDSDEYAYGKMYLDTVPFHLQSKSLGFEPFKLMTDEEKKNVYLNGKSFVGDGEIYNMPVYVKNKLCYDLYYIVTKSGQRLCRRKASAFFEKYRKVIFDRKAQWTMQYLKQSESVGYFTSRGLDTELATEFANRVRQLRIDAYSIFGDEAGVQLETSNYLGKMYLAYHNVSISNCFAIDLCEQWMRRYRTSEVNNVDIDKLKLYDSFKLNYFRQYWSFVDMANSYLGSIALAKREEAEAMLARIRDFYNNLT